MFVMKKFHHLNIKPHSIQVVLVDRLWSKECAAISANLANTTTSAPSYVNHAILNVSHVLDLLQLNVYPATQATSYLLLIFSLSRAGANRKAKSPLLEFNCL